MLKISRSAANYNYFETPQLPRSPVVNGSKTTICKGLIAKTKANAKRTTIGASRYDSKPGMSETKDTTTSAAMAILKPAPSTDLIVWQHHEAGRKETFPAREDPFTGDVGKARATPALAGGAEPRVVGGLGGRACPPARTKCQRSRAGCRAHWSGGPLSQKKIAPRYVFGEAV